MITLDNILVQDVHVELPSLDNVLKDIKEMISAVMSYTKKAVNSMLIPLMLGSMPINAQASLDMTTQPYEIVVDTNSQTPQIADFEEVFPHHYRIQERIKELKALEANWDGFGAKEVSEDALALVGRFTEVLSEEVINHCSVFPAANSDVFLQGQFAKGSLIASFSKEGVTYVLKGYQIERLSASRVPLYSETVQKLNDVIVDKLLV